MYRRDRHRGQTERLRFQADKEKGASRQYLMLYDGHLLSGSTLGHPAGVLSPNFFCAGRDANVALECDRQALAALRTPKFRCSTSLAADGQAQHGCRRRCSCAQNGTVKAGSIHFIKINKIEKLLWSWLLTDTAYPCATYGLALTE